MSFPPFSEQWDAGFRPAPFWLRFELGGDVFGNDEPVSRFIQAFGRARQITQDVFESSRTVMGIVVTWPGTVHELFAPADDGFAALHDAGFFCAPIGEWNAPLYPGEDEDDDRVPATWRAFDLSSDSAARDVLLWCAVSYEMRVTPKAPVSSYLMDNDQGLLVHVYDDRGMDVAALEPDRLLPVYRARNAWLLDHDRARMAEMIDPNGNAPV